MNYSNSMTALAVLCLTVLAGCSNPWKRSDLAAVDHAEVDVAADAGASDSRSNVSLVSASEPGKTTFLDDPALQAGAGRMDGDADSEFKTTATGLRYRVLRHSKGRKPTARNEVTVHYRGWLDNGRVFDSSYDRGEPISFPLNGVVRGWTEGMQLVGEGGMIELWLPSRLGYGAQGSPPAVPPFADLHFVVELIKVR